MIEACVPIAPSLGAIYPPSALAGQAPRWAALTDSFSALFGALPTFVARAPGRVNIIGEHIDYSLYAVLPAAITLDTLVAVRATLATGPSEDTSFRVALRNTASAFPPRDFVFHNGEVDIDAAVPDWSNYFKAGLRGALEHLKALHGRLPASLDLQVLVDGRVPVGGGLSSSAAFVTASALAVLHAYAQEQEQKRASSSSDSMTPAAPAPAFTTIDKKALTELAIVSERAVGVNSGGMDQSASVFAQESSVLHVCFSPSLHARPVRMPPTNPPTSLLIVNSCVAANKRLTAPREYNLRVVECSLAAAVLHAAVNSGQGELERDSSPLGVSLRGFHNAYARAHPQRMAGLDEAGQLDMLLEEVGKVLTQHEGYSRADVAQLLGWSATQVEERFFAAFPVEGDVFMLQQRATHVFAEARRVLQFVELLETESKTGEEKGADTLGQRMGELMNASQQSCRDFYECSHPALDRICEIARSNGSYGSRLTGAGWGGCSVHLVPADKVASVTAALEKEYFAGLELAEAQREDAVIVTKPGSGCAVYEVQEEGGLEG
ncbi:Galactokinase [Ceratocystis platani]|uniref:Galactokinase n=1 Tax=Ceratocystis fimbriata f. sp. platani TaxID=88771 RepID=A0A0F8CPE0_CERFI|nr:Galactokinase [Ceratocystis platani]